MVIGTMVIDGMMIHDRLRCAADIGVYSRRTWGSVRKSRHCGHSKSCGHQSCAGYRFLQHDGLTFLLRFATLMDRDFKGETQGQRFRSP